MNKLLAGVLYASFSLTVVRAATVDFAKDVQPMGGLRSIRKLRR